MTRLQEGAVALEDFPIAAQRAQIEPMQIRDLEIRIVLKILGHSRSGVEEGCVGAREGIAIEVPMEA